MIIDTKIIKEFLPNLKLRNSFDTTPDYLNYISSSIDKATEQANELLLTGHSSLKPLYKIKNLFKNKPLDLSDIKEIEEQANRIRSFKVHGE
ncbi:MAG: hypothetical protein ISR29_00725 [SAR86 cluster bacterium]|uniref:Uncharacterized protein n=1 Tax=SAR86 cluster bacterium TaxID=2030880 RepID=A0A937JA38_9GAMM|nr:hypothetical protein [SAR86 cluster bacterium]